MKNIFFQFIVFAILFIGIISVAEAQNQTTRLNKKSVDIDTLSYLKINKLIFYQHPLLLEYGFLVDKNYVPDWYKAYCANSNYEYFKDYPKEAVSLFQSISGVTEEMLAEHVKSIEDKGGLKKAKEMLPYSYIYGEIWLTYLKTGEQIVITQGYESEKEIHNLKFNQIIVKQNKPNERTDSLKLRLVGTNAYIFEDGILKRANQPLVLGKMISNNSTYVIGNSVRSFKDVLFRAPTYIRSVIKDGKRIFETIENTPTGPVVKSVSDKP